MPQEKYVVKKFYKRSHKQSFSTLEGAKAHLLDAGLNSNTEFYAEIWKMENDEDGEQVAFLERGLTELVMK